MASRKSRIQEIVKKLRTQGFRVRRTSNNHWRVYPPDRSKHPITLPSSPSDLRSIKNSKAALRRAGAEL